MNIINGLHPPNIGIIDAAFSVKDKPNILYCYGTDCFNPTGFDVPEHLIAHETVHSVRQGSDPDGWWHRYIVDKQFRLSEELVAHRTELAVFYRDFKDRNLQSRYLHSIAQRLSGPLYGNLLTHKQARERILGL